jgi:hypothetical protein
MGRSPVAMRESYSYAIVVAGETLPRTYQAQSKENLLAISFVMRSIGSRKSQMHAAAFWRLAAADLGHCFTSKVMAQSV